MSQSCLIIGASHAAAQLAISLRQEGWTGTITVIGDEEHIPYHRPPLSKGFLSGDKNLSEIYIRPEALYEKQNIDFRLNTRVIAIDRDNQAVTLDSGKQLTYDKLALTVGARVRKIDLPGKDLNGIHYLRSANNAMAIRQGLQGAKNAVIVGGGYIGLELAASIRKAGVNVTVLEMLPRVLARVTAPEVSTFYTRIHTEEGVDIKTEAVITEFTGQGNVTGVKCSDGSQLPADIVIVGVGVIPNIALAESIGLACENGIAVDQFARTEDANIVAAGDCTNHPNELLGRNIRLESVPNATEQAKSAAASLCGKNKPYTAIPWFWSDQYDLKLQIAGMNQGYDQVIIRGNTKEGRSFAAFYLKEGNVIAADCINRPQEFMIIKQALTKGIKVKTERLADESVTPRELLISE